ncbi:glycosyltransferase [Flavobacterium sp. 316]|uniref:glycosyltransferase n=1 Tax=Flavobacterium sp. 316 TaxID=1603293 RepID=UPI0005DE5B4A|nr:glycosyltransferase [Flavobacterium sp. 316]KIX21032.1 glycosyltransferase [Flavobacterium sp. 316]
MKNRILVAPLNWGLGHATRCIPIIRALEKSGFEPVIASDGIALELLKKEFAHLITLELPSYQIKYSEKGKNFKIKLFSQLPTIIKAIKAERIATENIIKEYNISGLISDNRLGVYSKNIPSVFITHQLNVLTGNTTWISTKIHHHYIKKYNECWVPDMEKKPNLSGKLGHLEDPFSSLKYIGPLSRLHKKVTKNKYELMVILSGPEPQRTLLEKKLITELENYTHKTLFIKGIIEDKQSTYEEKNITYYNFMNSEQLEIAFNESSTILCRSGYTTIMDLAQLGKKAFFIPTPGQYEQEYLAKKLKQENIAPSCNQDNFSIEKLEQINSYKGFLNFSTEISWKKLFSLFQGK